MRPITRGEWPEKPDGTRKTYSNYRSWRRDLVDRMGSYCAFCNMTLTDSPQVEHVIAQDINASRALDWDNLVLACGACNRSKSAHACPPSTHYLPQFHNTHLAFTIYTQQHPDNASDQAAFVRWRGLPAIEQNAKNTIDLCKLDEDTTRYFSQFTDQRWKRRHQAVINASTWRGEWETWEDRDEDMFAKLLITVAKASGFWSVWFDAFEDVDAVRRLLVTEFEGTNINAFDGEFRPVNLNGAEI